MADVVKPAPPHKPAPTKRELSVEGKALLDGDLADMEAKFDAAEVASKVLADKTTARDKAQADMDAAAVAESQALNDFQAAREKLILDVNATNPE